MTVYNEFLRPDEVIKIVSNLTVDDEAFIVGGQATFLWAGFYETMQPELEKYKPFTSKDIDYYGGVQAAEKLAEAIGGTVKTPDKDSMNSPSTAIVEANMNGRPIIVDFLHDIIGVKREEFRNGVTTIMLRSEDGSTIEVAVMHPVLCLKSRIGNIMSPATQRRDEIAIRQINAAWWVVRTYIDDALEDNDHKEAVHCLSDLFCFLRSHQFGRNAHDVTGTDVLDILKHFVDDTRLDERWRKRTLIPAIEKIESRREARARRATGGMGILS
jgi:hypothetical protein